MNGRHWKSEDVKMKNLYEEIIETKDKLGLTYEDIATKATALKGSNVSKSTVGTWFDSELWEAIEIILKILGKKHVDENEVCVTPETYKALKSMAKLGIDHL